MENLTKLKKIRFATDNTLTLKTEGSGIAGQVALGYLGVEKVINATGINTKGTLVLGLGTEQQITGQIGADGARLKIVTLHGIGNATSTIKLIGNNDAKLAAKIYSETLNLGKADNNTLHLEENTLVDCNIEPGNGNDSKIVVKGNATITGTIGAVTKIDSNTFDTARQRSLLSEEML